jgi:hypothetical protein
MANSAGWFSEVLNGSGVATVSTPVESTDPAAGSAISVHVFWQVENAGEPTVTDTAGNTYTAAGSGVSGAVRYGRSFVALDIDTSADFQVTVTWASGIQYAISVAALEIVGAATTSAVGVTGGQEQNPGVTGAGATTSGTLSAPSEDGHLVHAASSSNSWPDNYDIDSPFTEAGRAAGAGYVIHGYNVQGTAAAATATFTQDATATTVTIATTIKAASGGGGGSVAFRPYYF